jgi:DNA polymerase (family 10)
MATTIAPLSNSEVADRLDEVANLLEEQGGNQFRVQAWRGGAATIRRLTRPLRDVLAEEGLEGLDRLPGIGQGLARAVRQLIETGRLATLERLRGESDPAALLASVPGIGHTFARRIHDRLGIESLEELELAAHDGRLASLDGIGSKRLTGIRDALGTRLRNRRRSPPDDVPDVAELLDVDREYREGAAAGKLSTIAPRRFNPLGESWLPILHTTRGERHYTALFSNTATAHRLNRSHDWVVIYWDGRDGERQCTVVTELKGPLIRRRVVRGRESECFTHYRPDTNLPLHARTALRRPKAASA